MLITFKVLLLELSSGYKDNDHVLYFLGVNCKIILHLPLMAQNIHKANHADLHTSLLHSALIELSKSKLFHYFKVHHMAKGIWGPDYHIQM